MLTANLSYVGALRDNCENSSCRLTNISGNRATPLPGVVSERPIVPSHVAAWTARSEPRRKTRTASAARVSLLFAGPESARLHLCGHAIRPRCPAVLQFCIRSGGFLHRLFRLLH
jgi:hypothetical protein